MKSLSKVVGRLFLAIMIALMVVQAVNADNPKARDPRGKAIGLMKRAEPQGKASHDPRDPSGIDACELTNTCGTGDHGMGNPVVGSLNANCNAQHGEVDPMCEVSPTVPPKITPPIVPPIATPPVNQPVCKLVVWGETPEIFEAGIDVHDPANEVFVLAEAHGYLEVTLPMGFRGTIFWYRGSHSGSIAQGFVCNSEFVEFYEPFIGDWME